MMVQEFDKDQFSKRLIEIMKERRINCTSLAIWIGTEVSVVSAWRYRGVLPKIEYLFSSCCVLDISADWLLGLTDGKKKLGVIREFDKARFQHRLLNTMIEKKITVAWLINEIDSNNTTICGWRSGKGLPGTDNLFRLCQALDISADWLLGLRDDDG